MSVILFILALVAPQDYWQWNQHQIVIIPQKGRITVYKGAGEAYEFRRYPQFSLDKVFVRVGGLCYVNDASYAWVEDEGCHQFVKVDMSVRRIIAEANG